MLPQGKIGMNHYTPPAVSTFAGLQIHPIILCAIF